MIGHAACPAGGAYSTAPSRSAGRSPRRSSGWCACCTLNRPRRPSVAQGGQRRVRRRARCGRAGGSRWSSSRASGVAGVDGRAPAGAADPPACAARRPRPSAAPSPGAERGQLVRRLGRVEEARREADRAQPHARRRRSRRRRWSLSRSKATAVGSRPSNRAPALERPRPCPARATLERRRPRTGSRPADRTRRPAPRAGDGPARDESRGHDGAELVLARPDGTAAAPRRRRKTKIRQHGQDRADAADGDQAARHAARSRARCGASRASSRAAGEARLIGRAPGALGGGGRRPPRRQADVARRRRSARGRAIRRRGPLSLQRAEPASTALMPSHGLERAGRDARGDREVAVLDDVLLALPAEDVASGTRGAAGRAALPGLVVHVEVEEARQRVLAGVGVLGLGRDDSRAGVVGRAARRARRRSCSRCRCSRCRTCRWRRPGTTDELPGCSLTVSL